MADIQKGIACRICKHNEDGVCCQGNQLPVDKKDECWYFQNKNQNSALAEYSETSNDWN